MKNLLFNNVRIYLFSTKPQRKMIQPQPFTNQKFDNYYLIRSSTYEFLISRLPQKHQIYKHEIDTPASVLKKSGLHILPKQIPQVNRRQKLLAISRKISMDYQKSYKKCIKPKEFFHMSRKTKHDILKRLQFIGIVQQKYKYHMLYQSLNQKIKQKTKEQYMKKGVKVHCLGFTIYPKGDVWMPTNQKYLKSMQESLSRMEGDKTVTSVLDIGTGSGVLAFLCAKTWKKAKVVAFDSNQAAVDTCNVTAAENKFDNVTAFKFDVTKVQEFAQKIKQQKIPQLYDIITMNPPWLHAKKLANQSQLQDGVYDENGKMLESSFKLAGKHLKDKNSKILLIYSDLNKILGLQKKSIQQLCQQNSLLIHSVKQRALSVNLQQPSPLNQFKQQAKIQFFEIRKS